MPRTLITGANRGLGSSLAASIWPMDGRSTQLVVIQPLLGEVPHRCARYLRSRREIWF